MDNHTLLDQAQHLYAVLHVEQYALSIENKRRFDRLDHIVIRAYWRYLRRLNRCVLCYQHSLNYCVVCYQDRLYQRRLNCCCVSCNQRWINCLLGFEAQRYEK
jgi:hypothetical protein